MTPSCNPHFGNDSCVKKKNLTISMILDCTLRDGGYYTNWNFDTQMVKDLVQHLTFQELE